MVDLRVCKVRVVVVTHSAQEADPQHSEVFVIVSLTLFLPICLEQFARDNGYLLPDKTVPCVGNTKTTTVVGIPEARCVVKLGWKWVDTASFR